jgi:hypothetical protein
MGDHINFALNFPDAAAAAVVVTVAALMCQVVECCRDSEFLSWVVVVVVVVVLHALISFVSHVLYKSQSSKFWQQPTLV